MRLQFNTEPQAGINFLLYAVAQGLKLSTDVKALVCGVGQSGLCIGADKEMKNLLK
jgi:hypothetical protein